MAIITSLTTPANGTAAVFNIITQLCSAGWNVTAWSDATTLTTAVTGSNPFYGFGSGANNLGNTSAWFRIRAGDGSKEWMFQRSTTDLLWTAKRGKGTFTGGTPNATTPGTDATSATLFTAATLWPTIIGDLVLSMDNSSYSFTMMMVPLTSGNVQTMLWDEVFATGTYPTTPVANADPYVFGGYFNNTGLAAGAITISEGSAAIGYHRYRHGLGGASNVRINYCPLYYIPGGAPMAPASSATAQLGPDPITGVEVPERIVIGMPGAISNATGRVGKPDRHRWATVFSGRSNGQCLYDGTDHWMYMAGVWFKWDASRPVF